MRWFERPEVLSYIIDAYQGMDGAKRQWAWEEENGDVVIGNARAFADHLSQRFHLELTDTAWSGLHEAMRMLGEVAKAYSPRARSRGGKFRNQQPEVRVITRRRK